jgi:uncharacterized protein YkwD
MTLRLNRRSFATLATTFALSSPAILRAQALIERGRFSDEELPLAREQLLQQVNTERSAHGLSHLKLDELACKVANKHAEDMASGLFLSHWGSDGRKPFHRYSMAGGTAAVQENCSAADDIQSVSSSPVLTTLHDMHQSMVNETPPHDGHRKTILDPFHTHVGFGIALNSHSLRLDELYLARYLQFDPVPAESKPRATVRLSGRLLNPRHSVIEIAIFYEPPPKPPDIFWLRTPRSVSLPDEVVRLRPRVADPVRYEDGGHGDFDLDSDGGFRARVPLFKSDPGIYTIVCAVRRTANDQGFPGGQVCIVAR